MCIIAYKPEGVNFPTESTLRTCFNNNPDGAGFMYPENGQVHIRKGFMNFNDFNKAISSIRNRSDLPVVMHFRISTHAGVVPEMTQPFPVSSKTNKLRKIDTYSNIGVAHNGIIQMTRDAKNISDTALFIKRYMSYLITDSKYYEDYRTSNIIETLIGSKMAILSNDGHVEILGSGWVSEKDGMMYSNDSYEEYNFRNWYKGYKKSGKSTKYSWYDWYDGSYNDYYGSNDYYSSTISGNYNEDVGKDMSDEELEEWLEYRETCEERIATHGGSCYGCKNESYCHAI